MGDPVTDKEGLLIRWPVPTGARNLGPTDVHVWAAALDLPSHEIEDLSSILSDAERDRAERFRFARHRNRFIAGRGLLRTVLGEYLTCAPEQLEFSYGPFGKPSLRGSSARGGLQFNLAHSEDLALLAVTRAGAIGVDVERVRVLEDFKELVNRFFSPSENARFGRLLMEQRPAAFFNLWTRKEAWLKATGEGIGQYLNGVEVSFLPEEAPRLLQIPSQLGPDRPWCLHHLAPAEGFVAALAVAAANITVRLWAWREALRPSPVVTQPVPS
jgi:4'-phosphopantetheinyl transferase